MKHLTLISALLKLLLALLILGTLCVACDNVDPKASEHRTDDFKFFQRIAVVLPDSDNPISTLPFTFVLAEHWHLEDAFLIREPGTVQVARLGSVSHSSGISITFYVGMLTEANDPFDIPSLTEPPFVTHEFSSNSAKVRITLERVDYIAKGKVRLAVAWSNGTFVAISGQTEPIDPPTDDVISQLRDMLLSIET